MSTYSSRAEGHLSEFPAPEFDERTQAAFDARFRNCPPEAFLAELQAFAPRTPSQRTAYELYRGWALYDAGRYLESRSPLILALRGARPGSAQRSLLRGLLGECYLRTGQFLRAERCARRALAGGCEEDPDGHFEAGHRFMLGRIQRFLGHLTHAEETFQEALGADRSGAFAVSILTEIAEVHLLRGEYAAADRTLDRCRLEAAYRHGPGQGWTMALVECPLALALGDVERAERVVDGATREHYARSGERVRLYLTMLRATVLSARGQHRKAELLLQGVLDQTELGGRNSDVVAAAARALAEVLQRRERFADAVTLARLAARAGWCDDRIEWVRALRIEGECLWAQGAHAEARRVFREASSVHAGTQFLDERRILQRMLEPPGPGRAPEPVRLDEPAAPKSTRLALASGRGFVSCDRGLIESIGFAARTDLPVLIEGETGTGKELVARLIHEMGPRARRPWVVLDCSALPEALADAELFGARRGAYTGAVSERGGLMAEADGGTLFLDELAELPLPIQAKLLRVLQDGTYRRVGEDQPRRVVVRVVAATNRSAQSEIEAGRLKPDLFYRLCGHRVFLPPLRARRHEVGPLAVEFARALGGVEISPEALAWLAAQPWPGNVRQLEMQIRLAISAREGPGRLEREHLEALRTRGSDTAAAPVAPLAPADSLIATRREGERAALQRVLREHGGVVREAARQLGVSRQALYKALRRTGLAPARVGRTA